MNALACSVGSYCHTPKKLSALNSAQPACNLDPAKASNVKLPAAYGHEGFCQQLQQKEAPSLFWRRETLGLGLFSGLLDFMWWQPQSSPALAEEAPCELSVSPSGLAFCDSVEGTGAQAMKGQLIKAHYIGRLENGKVFDSSYSRGKPLTFRVGVGEVIKGWDEGILGSDGVPPMLAGGKRKLKLPPELGYGIRGAGCRGGSCIIPPDSVLLFDVELIGKAS